MNPPSASVERARRILAAYAENDSDPWTRRLLAEAADALGPRLSGPSRSMQRVTARRDDALRRLYRSDHASKSVRRAATEIAARAGRYADTRLKYDLAASRPPIGGIELIVYDAVRDGARVPGVEQLRVILGGRLEA